MRPSSVGQSMLLMRRREVFPVDGGDGGDDAATGARQLVTPLLTVGLPQPAGLEDSPSFATVPLTPMASKASRINLKWPWSRARVLQGRVAQQKRPPFFRAASITS